MNRYAKFIEDLVNAGAREKMPEVGGYAARIKKEVAYSMVFEEDIDPEKFIYACHRYLEFRSEEAKRIISPMLRALKLELLNI
jgi:hypothetical protein